MLPEDQKDAFTVSSFSHFTLLPSQSLSFSTLISPSHSFFLSSFSFLSQPLSLPLSAPPPLCKFLSVMSVFLPPSSHVSFYHTSLFLSLLFNFFSPLFSLISSLPPFTLIFLSLCFLFMSLPLEVSLSS